MTPEAEARITGYMNSARWIAWKFHRRLPSFVELDDIVQEAYLAVVRYDPRWDPDKGSYSTYMAKRVWGALIDYLRSQDNVSRSERKVIGNKQTTMQFSVREDEESEKSLTLRIDEAPAQTPSFMEHLILDDFINFTNDVRARRALEGRLEGFKAAELAEELGVCQSRISQLVTHAKAVYRTASIGGPRA